MKALITGGSGYFGSLLTKKLLENGYECTIFDLNDASDRPAGVNFIQGDIRDKEKVAEACKGMDIVHHNVAQVPLAKDAHLFYSVNIDGMENVLASAKSEGVKKVLYTSSSAVFGVPKRAALPVRETTQPNPAEAYGNAKYFAERLCRAYADNGLDVSIVRPRTILGHGRLGIFQILFEWVSEGRHIPVLGSGDNVYQFVHADDLAQVCMLAGENPGSEIYNCGAVRYGTMRSMLEALCHHAGTGAKVRSLPMKPTVWGMKVTSRLGLSPLSEYHWLMYGKSMYFDNEKVKNELGYEAKYSNEEMICDSYDWYINNRDSLHFAGEGESIHRSALHQGILKLLKWVS